MKVSAIEKICKEARCIRLLDVDGVQWVAADGIRALASWIGSLGV